MPCLSKENIFKVTEDNLNSEWNSEVTMFGLTLLSLERQDDEMRRLENNRKLVLVKKKKPNTLEANLTISGCYKTSL